MKDVKIGKVHIEVMQWLQENGRKGGRAKSPSKSAAARANGAKGGRPKKKCGLFAVVRGYAPSPLIALQNYGFKLTYGQRKIIREERNRGAVATATDDLDGVLMSRNYTANNGKTFTSRTWVFPDGSTYSYSEPAAMHNDSGEPMPAASQSISKKP